MELLKQTVNAYVIIPAVVSAYASMCVMEMQFISDLKDDIFLFKKRKPLTILLFILFGPGYGVVWFGIIIVAFLMVMASETFDLVQRFTSKKC